MSVDIYCSIPWRCDDKDCRHDWHLATYFVGDGGPACSDTEGDQAEACDDADLPSAQREREAWIAYYQHCAETGSDPLGELVGVRTAIVRDQTWQVRFRDWVGNRIRGICFAGARRNARGAWQRGDDLPEEVRAYLCIERSPGEAHNYAAPEWQSTAALAAEIDADTRCRRQRDRWFLKFLLRVPVTTWRGPAAVARDVRKAARAALAAARD